MDFLRRHQTLLTQSIQTIGSSTLIYLIIICRLVKTETVSSLCPQECTCTPGIVNKNIVEIRCQGLTKLPEILPPAMTYRLLLSNNDIKELQPRSYLLLTDYIDLSYNNINNITSEAFNQLLHNTRYLYLQGNQMECFNILEDKEEALHKHKSLQEINFSENPWDCQCLSNLLEELDKHLDHISVLKARDQLKCDQNLNSQPKDSKPPWLSSNQSALTKRDGFYAFVATLVALLTVFVILIVLYCYRYTTAQKNRLSQHNAHREDILPII